MKYSLLHAKKLIRMLPFTLALAVVFLLIASIVFSTAADFVKNEQLAKFGIDVVGESDSRFFKTGLLALQTLDASNISIDMKLTDEETAKNDLRTGQVSAYVVIPEGFMQASGRGEIMPIAYYTTASTVDISALMRDEVTVAIATVLKYSQKAIFGEEALLRGNGYASIAVREINELDLVYIDFIMDRDHLYRTEITGISHGLNSIQHLFLGLIVVLLCVAVIPLACLHMRRDNSMLKMLKSAGKGAAVTVCGEYAAMLAVFLSVMGLLVLGGMLIGRFVDLSGFFDVGIDLTPAVACVFPITVMVCAFAFLLFEMASSLISAVTGFFFVSFGLCYISGCMYPVYALPLTLQHIAGVTPTGIAREYLFSAVTGGKTALPLLGLALYTLLFVAVSILIRRRQLARGEG
ncbi:MAG: ABC transporter permease [Clostridia bacterium]|nr:ABC transporter permease [Clostridia bacterium]